MKRKCYPFLLLFLSLTVGLEAQATLKGTVTDRTGETLIGTNIVVEGTTKGTVTDFEGNYQLSDLPTGEEITILFSYTGYVTERHRFTLQDEETRTFDLVMQENSEMLDEVVVVGYGTKRKSELTGSIAKIESSEITEIVTPSFESALQGQAAGVQVVQGSGLAGSASIVRIRGNSSLSSGGDPLYVVDGIPITQDYFLGENRANQNNNPLSSLNPNDIESVEILKDASAAAIYGSRGANGVIIITTKRGKKGKPQFNFNTRLGLSEPTNVIGFLNGPELLQIHQEAWENDGNTGRAPLPRALTNQNYDAENYTYEEVEQINTDWFDEVIQTGFKQQYNLSMRQGGDFISTYAGASYSNDETYLVGNRFERLSGRLNFDINLLKNLKVGISTSLARGVTDRIDPLSNGLGLAQSTALPIFPIFNKEGEYFRPDVNPVAKQDLTRFRTVELRSINNIQLNYTITPELTLTAQGSYDYMNLKDNDLVSWEWLEVTTGRDDPNNILLQDTLGLSKQWTTRVNNWSTFATLDYQFDKLIKNQDHQLGALFGIEYQQKESTGRFREFRMDGFVYNTEIPSDSTLALGSSRYNIEDERFFSLFTRLNYAFRDKYFLQFTFRRDGSSRFGPNNRFGNFPSIGLGWIASRENWWQSSFLTYLKVKASWGRTGNANIPWTEQFATYSFLREGENNSGLTYNLRPIRFQNKAANPDLQWEVVTTYDGGFELGFWEDRLTAEIVYYYQRTTDGILNAALQATTGWEQLAFFRNTAKIENQGLEFTLTSTNFSASKTGGFGWTTSLNLSHNRNKVLEVGTATPDALAGGFGDTRAIVGEAMNTNFIIKYGGVDPDNGRPLYEEVDPDTKQPTGNLIYQYREAFDRQVAGNGMPDLVGGINNTLSWNNFDLSFFFVFSLGGEIYDDAAKRQLGVISIDNEGSWNVRRDLIGNYWQQPGDQTRFPRLTLDPATYGLNGIWNHNQTNWLEPASYLRLRTLTVGYNIPIQSNFVKRFRIYFTGQNLLTFTDYPGWDPEVARERGNSQERNIGGTSVTYLTPPQERAYFFGLEMDF